MWNIDKTFDFCFGHRVHTQVLNQELSCNSKCKCRHYHGHQGTIKIYLKSDKLNDQGMVLDFVELNWFKKWLDDVLDHKMILDMRDPALWNFYPLLKDKGDPESGESIVFLFDYHKEGYFTIRPDHYSDMNDYEKEIYEGLVVVTFVPTSENISRWIFNIVQKKLSGIATVSKVEFFETPKSRSSYEE